MYDKHPCNICKHEDKCWDIDCPLKERYNHVLVCQQYGCFLNYEGCCKIGAYDHCGARMTADGKEPVME